MFLGSHPSQSSLANRLRRSQASLAASRPTFRRQCSSQPNPRLKPGPRPSFASPLVTETVIHSVMSCVPAPTQTQTAGSATAIDLDPVVEAPVLPFVNVEMLEETSVANYKLNPAKHRYLSKSVPRALQRAGQEFGSVSTRSRMKRTTRVMEEEVIEMEEPEETREELCQPCWTKRTLVHWHKNLVAHHLQETPPLHITALLVLQLFLCVISLTVVVWLSLVRRLGLADDPETSGRLFSTLLFLTGLSSLAQTFAGIRLPLLHGPGLSAVLFLDSLPSSTLSVFSHHCLLLGLVCGGVQTLCGLFGLSSIFLRRLVGPLSLLPPGCLLALHFLPEAGALLLSSPLLTSLLLPSLLLFPLLLGGIRVPFCLPPLSACLYRAYPLFRTLGLLVALLLVLGVDAAVKSPITTPPHLRNATPTVNRVPWAFLPFPGQFRAASSGVEWTPVLAKALPLAAVGMLRSLGDYLSTARFTRVPPPPVHAVNRAQMIDGLMTALSGVLGLPPVSAMPEFTGISLLSNVASRSVHLFLSILLLLSSCLPRPLLHLGLHLLRVSGPLLLLHLSLLLTSSLALLAFVSILHARNLALPGLALALPLALAPHLPLSPLIVATLLALILDALLPSAENDDGRRALREDPTRFPGSAQSRQRGQKPEERSGRSMVTEGRAAVRRSQEHMYVGREARQDTSVYELPFVSTSWLMGRRWAERTPVLPSFTGHGEWCGRGEEEEQKEERGMGRRQHRWLMRSVSQGHLPANPDEPLL